MSLAKVIHLIEAMQTDGIIGTYALGGAMAAVIYVDRSLPRTLISLFT